MTRRETRYAVYGCEHPARPSQLLSRHRRRWTALLAAWWWRSTSLGDSHAWIREERVVEYWVGGAP